MKKRDLIIGMCLALTLAGCGNQTNDSSSQGSTDPSLITGILLSGPSTLTVGESFTLGVDVLGSDSDEVILSQSGAGQVSIDGLKITAVSVGEVIIKAVSKENEAVFAEKTLSIVGKNATSATLIISGNDSVTYDESSSYYTVPLGQDFVVSYSLPAGSNEDFKIAYSVSYPSDSQDGNFHLTQNEDGTATCRAYTAYQGISVVFKAYYDQNSTTPDITASIQMHVKDLNASSKKEVTDCIASFDEGDLLSSSVTKSFTETTYEGKTTSWSSSASFNAYEEGSFLSVSLNEDDATSTENYYSTVYEGRHYAFRYEDDGSVAEIITSEKSAASEYESPYLSLNGGQFKEGLNSLIGRFIDSSSEDSLLLFGDSGLYAYASFELLDGQIKATSSYESDSGALYEASLSISFNGRQLLSYVFKETMESEYDSFEYEEKGTSFEYGDKTADPNATIDMDSYFFMKDDLDYEIANDKDEDGRYDLSNPAKYFAGSGTEVDGVTTYSLTTSQAIAIRIKRKDGVDSLATTAIDTFSMTSSDETMVEPSSMLANASAPDGSGLFIISPYKDVSGNIKEGSALITITSQRGYSVSFRLSFSKAALSSIKVGGPTISDENETFSLGEIFLDSLSPYFTINGDPDESTYVWDIKIEEGPENGLELYHYEDGNIDNLYGYAVRGLKVGEYSFRISCSGSDVLSSNAYTITVKDSYSAETIEENVLNNDFIYKMGDSYKFTLHFESSSLVTLTQDISYSSSSLSASLACSIEKGRIALDEQTLPSGFYYSKIKGDLRFDEDFSTIKVYLGVLSTSDGTNGTLTYVTCSFVRYVDKSDPYSYLAGKEFTEQENHNYGGGYANYDYVLAFAKGDKTGSVSITKHSDSSLLASITFAYTYSEKTTQFTLSSIVSSNESVTISDASPYYSLGTSYGDYIELTFTGSMKTRFFI